MEQTENMSLFLKDYLFKDKRNKRIWWGIAVAVLLQFLIFKYIYPYASYIYGDSFSYIKAATQNADINTYLIGYSKFLRLFNIFFKSDFALVFFQYLFIQISCLFLLVTVIFFYNPSKIARTILFFFIVFNPLFLYLGNLVSSDGLFLALSMIWFTTLLWIIHRPSKRIILWNSVILFIAFTVRYNAMIYPLVTIAAFFVSKLPVKQKLIGVALSVSLCSFFVVFTSYHYKKLTGYWQYSPFSGWQLANNAMYSYRYVKNINRKPVPKRFEKIDNMIRSYFDSTRDTVRFPVEKLMASTVYMWSRELPLYRYRDSLFSKDTSEFRKWASIGPFFKSYGTYIIKRYPKYFLKYFIWPNTKKYYAPPVEFLATYNSNRNILPVIAQTWFGYSSRLVKPRTKDNKVYALDFYPILSGVINVVMLFSLLSFSLLNGFRQETRFRKGVYLGAVVWLANATFTIFASSAALRFQAFPILLTTTFMILLIDWLVMMASSTSAQTRSQLTMKSHMELILDH